MVCLSLLSVQPDPPQAGSFRSTSRSKSPYSSDIRSAVTTLLFAMKVLVWMVKARIGTLSFFVSLIQTSVAFEAVFRARARA